MDTLNRQYSTFHGYYMFLGNNGLTYIIQVISKLLDPKTSEYTASFVGRLVAVVLTKAGSQLGEQMDLMLRAVLSKMQQTETLSVMQVSIYHMYSAISRGFPLSRMTTNK